jgi:large subunit ribosomal protein L25
MATHEINVERRAVEGKGASRRLRTSGKIPAIVYGGGIDPVAIQLDHEKVWLAQQNEWFYSSILDLSLGGDVQKVLLRDIQRHPFKQLIMHLDFQRVSADQALRAKVPLHFLNEDKSPAGKAADVVVLHELNDVEVSCLPKDLPEFIEVDLSQLEVGHSIHVSAVKLPPGVSVVPHGRTDPVVAAAIVPRAHTETEEAAAGAEGAAAAAAAPTEAEAKAPEKKEEKKDDKKK